MKKTLAVLLCVLICALPLSVNSFAAKETETTSFVFQVDVNERYTDIINATEDAEFYELFVDDEEEKQTKNNRSIYIAVLISALVISVVILAVSLKRVPKEDDIDISGRNKEKKDKKSKD